MTVVSTATGEILDADVARDRAAEIGKYLDATGDDFEAAMDLLHTAIRERDDIALGYRSPGDYVSDRFGGKLARLGVDLRREVVRELTEAGMSTRAIAPVVGVSDRTVSSDQKAGAKNFAPAPQTPEGGAAPTVARSVREDTQPGVVDSPRPPVTGIDGKTYSRPAPAQASEPRRRPLADAFFNAAFDLAKTVERITRLAADDRFPTNAEKVAAKHRDDLLRARDALDGVIAQLP